MRLSGNAKLKILILGQIPPPWGGQAMNIHKMMTILNRHPFNCRLIPLNFSNEINDMGRLSGLKIIRLFKIFFKLLWQLCIFRPDIVYYPPAGPSSIPVFRDMVLLLPIRLFRFKTVFHFHAGGLSEIYSGLNVFLKLLFRVCYFRPDYAICLSKRGLKDPNFLLAKKTIIIPSGVEDPGPVQNPGTDTFIILFAGLCTEKKGVLDFIEVIRLARKQNAAVYGKILGKLYSEKEGHAIRSAEKEGILTYEGQQTGLVKINHFNTSQVFLFPSFFEAENFPTVILEAFASGLPVIASDWRGIPDQVQHLKNGYICKLHDINCMAGHIIYLSQNPDQYRELSRNARNDFETKYTMDIFEHSMVAFFNSVK